MIRFRCSGCGRELMVDRDKAGKTGKCPSCSSIIIVPFHSENEMIFDQNEITCSNPQLQNLYDNIINQHGNKINRHAIPNRECLVFEIITNEAGTRRQIVGVGSFKTGEQDSEGMVCAFSEIGKISNPDSAIVALRFAHVNPVANISLDEDNLLSVKMAIDIRQSPQILWNLIYLLALTADKLEEALFGWDLG